MDINTQALNDGFIPEYKDVRIDGFHYDTETGKTDEHVMRYFDTIKQGLNAAKDMRRDGYKTYLMYHVWNGLYDILQELTD